MDFTLSEDTDGVRFSWNSFPPNKLMHERLTLPVGMVYTPLREIEDLEFVSSNVVACHSCKAILNPYISQNLSTGTYQCPFCSSQQQFSKEYKAFLQQGTQIPEITANTIEYLITEEPRNVGYLFVVDKVVPEKELRAIKTAILDLITKFDDDVHVGLISFDANIFLHDLDQSEFLSEKALNGTKFYDTNKLAYILGIGLSNYQMKDVNHKPSPGLKKFIKPLKECRSTFENVLKNLNYDTTILEKGMRELRCTGAALKAAITLAKGWYQDGLQLVTFVGGPCTQGPGTVVDLKREIFIRSQKDLENDEDKIKRNKWATEFYDKLAQEASECNASCALFAFTCDQFGYYEMKKFIQSTGCMVVTHEEFKENVFESSLNNFFKFDEEGYLDKAMGTRVEISTSKGLKVRGAVGPCISLGVKSSDVAEFQISEGGTCSWFCGTLDPSSSLCFFFEPEASSAKAGLPCTIQVRTYYKHACGQSRLRVTTVQRKFGNENNHSSYIGSLDQEAAIVLTAKLAMHLSIDMGPKDIMRFLDRKLIQLYFRFGEYNHKEEKSFKICEEVNLIPQFFYFLRKSTFILMFAVSLDEHFYIKTVFMKENITNCLTMIQPSLTAYTLDSEYPEAAPCELGSLKNDCIVLFDSFFNVVIWHGKDIADWREQGIQEQEEYAYFKDLLEMSVEDSKYLSEGRFPAPRMVICDCSDQEERLIKSKVNPGDGGIDNQTVESGECITDDRSLKYFMDFLIKVVVQKDRQQQTTLKPPQQVKEKKQYLEFQQYYQLNYYQYQSQQQQQQQA